VQTNGLFHKKSFCQRKKFPSIEKKLILQSRQVLLLFQPFFAVDSLGEKELKKVCKLFFAKLDKTGSVGFQPGPNPTTSGFTTSTTAL
jgi:hypothetical protein